MKRTEDNQSRLEELQNRFDSIPEIRGSRILNSTSAFREKWGHVFNPAYGTEWDGEISNLFVGHDKVGDYSAHKGIVRAVKDEILRYCHDNGFEVFEDFSGNPACVVTRSEGYRPTAITYTETSQLSEGTAQLSLIGGVGGYSDALSYEDGKILVRAGFPRNIHSEREFVKPETGEVIELPKFPSKK
jgi:hypothetical protein